ncbi:MAG: Asp-tRNA(Asn)/Glu-tRNA(Gln) amidotransferase GatCAB subunit C [Gammaproteobacteria bacterium]|nr:Asp-tRNA(Asn)/Glu-tRNA(Gln) amidotransferase GatCAB subunit C [Gammaproteobacteria bacterium]|tara:strand:+ start:3621 stop:3902 length:282 start_codon:yes stop_codon:yes gene_type:complete
MNKNTVSKIANLAKIEIDDSKIEGIAENLEKILDLVGEMNSIDTDNINPMSHPLNLKQVMRPDEVTEQDQRENFQKNSPSIENGYYKVPKIID